MESDKISIESEAKRIEEDALYSSKGHFCAGARWNGVNLWLGIISTIFSAIAGASALSQFDSHNIVAGVLAIFVAVFSALITFINPNEKASNHKNAGNRFNALRNDVRLFHQVELEKIILDKAIVQLKKFNDRRNKLNLDSPQIPRWAFVKARKGIEEGESEYRVDR